MAISKWFDTFDIFGTRSAQNDANKAMQAQANTANQYKNEMGQYANNQFDYFNNASNSILGALANSKQDASATIDNINQSYDTASDKQNAQLAAMGYTPSSNSVYADNNASLEKSRANSIAQAQNQANQQNFNNTLSGVGQAGNMYQQGYGNYNNYLGNAYGMQQGVNNMYAANAQNRYNSGMQTAGSILGALAGFM